MTIYVKNGIKLEPSESENEIPVGAVWLDLKHITDEEEIKLEGLLNIDIPSESEMQALQVSDRLYYENDTLYLIVSLISSADSLMPELKPVAFVIRNDLFITVRNADYTSISTFATRFNKKNASAITPQNLFLEMVEYAVHRIAGLLDRAGRAVENLSERIFRSETKSTRDQIILSALLRQIGKQNEFINKLTESLISVNRAICYAEQHLENEQKKENGAAQLKTISRDVQALSEHARFLSEKLTFLLDATLGMISIEQNNSVKALSITTLVFMPPTLIAGIYGMNFEFMPELSSPYGYPTAVAAMALAAIAPYFWLKMRKKL